MPLRPIPVQSWRIPSQLEAASLRERLERRGEQAEALASEAKKAKEAAEAKAAEAEEKVSKAEATLEAAAAWEEHKKQVEERWRAELRQMEEDRKGADKVLLQASQQRAALAASRETLKAIEQALQQREMQLQSTWRQLKAQECTHSTEKLY